MNVLRPLGLPRTIDPDRLRLVLDHPDLFARTRRYVRELRLVATDLQWERGDGPDVRGSGEALTLAMVGRSGLP
ncbi:hypothetical protein ACFWB0_11670 [Rhodococcus sp. NPDC060086]|uniref:hypothetical protein n=1 Tax=Rhodococcus sp. NPDC060086 TaxID=3347055 RepID=UPI00364B6C2E